MSEKNSCTFCHREGLAILPVRPRIIKDEIANNYKCNLPDTISVPVAATKQTSYVGSELRSGYLYVYNEQTEEWLDFYATPDGYYYPLISGVSADQAVMKGEIKPCAREANELARASFITLPYFNNLLFNSVFWFAWAKVEWTDVVRKRHEYPNYRNKYMQKFDMKKWVEKQTEDNCYLLEQLKETIIEYNIPQSDKDKLVYNFFDLKNTPFLIPKFLFSEVQEIADEFFSLKGDKNPDALIQEAQAVSGKIKPLIIVLNDPVAIMEDIGKLCDDFPKNEIFSNPKYERGIWLNSTLNLVKENVIKQEFDAIMEEKITNKIALASYMSQSHIGASDMANAMPYVRESTKEQYEDEAMKKALNTWATYDKYIDGEQQQAFNQTVNKLVEKLEKEVIEPLIDSFKVLIFHEQTINYFISNFDDQNIKSGTSFSQMVISAFLPMLVHKIILDECIEMLKVKKLEEKHYFVRTYYLNQKLIEDLLEEAYINENTDGLVSISRKAQQAPPPDFSVLPWQYVVETIGKINEIKPGLVVQAMDDVAYALSAPLMKFYSQPTVSNIPNRAVVFATAIATQKLIPVHIEASYDELLEIIKEKAAQIIQEEGKYSLSEAKKIARKFLKDNNISKKGKNGRGIFTTYLYIDPTIEGSINHLPKKERLDIFRQALQVSSKEVVEKQKIRIEYKNALFNVKVNGISAIIQAAILFRTAESAFATDASNETTLRWASGAFALGGTILAGFESAVNTFSSLKAIAGNSWFLSLVMAGRGFILVAGVISISYDLKHFFDEWSKGNKGMAILYGVSAGSMFVLTGLGVLGLWHPVLIVIASIAYFVSQFLIATFTDNELQKWLQRCMWGKLNDTSLIPFNTFEQEQAAFNQLIEETV
ncbi:T6SS effector BTH_I2691 family protein [Thorsellia kenyensis]|uniref:T6SS effector BTH_I2691 family protein n=1 Tax=Thorsellia kenyensis TaxID=1549888 RepID=A0ABV6CAE3_9GAMM